MLDTFNFKARQHVTFKLKVGHTVYNALKLWDGGLCQSNTMKQHITKKNYTILIYIYIYYWLLNNV